MPGSQAIIARVDEALGAFLAERTASLAVLGDDLLPLTDVAGRLVLGGGKRLRPLFAYWGWRTTRPASDDDTALLNAAASLELLHACALVHDDVMDESATRRGAPSAHRSLSAMATDSGWPGDPDVFGTAGAILLGDLLLSWADAMFAGAGLRGDAQRDARRIYNGMCELVMAGQYLDVLEQVRGSRSAEAALRVVKYKTSKYTVEGPLHLGAAAAQAPPAVFDALSAYGLALGEAFQLRDDILGVWGDPGRTGKPSGDDLREGKRTLLVALALERAAPAQAELLRSHLGDRALDETGSARLCEVIVSTGALARVESRIAERARQARSALEDPALSPEARTALDGLVTMATERSA